MIDQEPNKVSDRIKVEVYPAKYLLDSKGKIILVVKDADKDVWNKIEGLIDDQR